MSANTHTSKRADTPRASGKTLQPGGMMPARKTATPTKTSPTKMEREAAR